MMADDVFALLVLSTVLFTFDVYALFAKRDV